MDSKRGCNFTDVVDRPTESLKDTKKREFKLQILPRFSSLETGPCIAAPPRNASQEIKVRRNALGIENGTYPLVSGAPPCILNRVSKLIPNAAVVFAPPQCFWLLYRPHGLNPRGRKGHGCLVPRYDFKRKAVNLVVLYSSYKGTYTRANTKEVVTANVMKKADNFIFASSVRW